MFLKKLLLVLSFQKRCFRKSVIRAVPKSGFDKNITIRNGVLYSDSSDIVIPSANITDVIFNRIAYFGQYKAIECALSGKSYTYEQIRTKSRNLSKFLRQTLQLQHGDVVAVVLTNRPECTVAALGILEAGLTVTSMNPYFTTVELAKQLLQSSAKAVITQVDTYPTVLSANQLNRRSSEIPIVLVKDKQSDSIHVGTIDYEEVTNTAIDGFNVSAASPEDIAFMPLSSGTTGLPKCIQLTHGNLVSAIYQQCHPDLEFSDPPSESHQDAIAAVLPFFHIFGFSTCMLISLFRGVKLITQPKFIPDKFVELLRNHEITYLMATPPLVLFLTSNDVKSEYLKHLKYMICGAAPLGELEEERFLVKAGKQHNIFQGYGMSETSMIALTATKQLQNVRAGGSVGKPIPNTRAKIISIDNADDTPLGVNEIGEVLINGPQVMIGYRGAPEENSKAFVDRWLKTGDLGYYDERGCLFIKDRLKEVIKVKGYQVAPAELEVLIRNFPAVEDAGVIGIPHPVFGEVPKAYVVEKKNSKLDTKELQEYINKNLIKYKRPIGGVEIIDAIPKNPSGKILRRELKQRFISTKVES